MTNPVYKIEINPGGSPDYTITADALNIHTHEILTSGIGTFDFTLPTKTGDGYQYEDVSLYDEVKIYLGYDSISASDLITVGKIYRITAPLNNESGYVRVFHCKNQGEILQRRIKGRKVWSSTEADDIVNEVASDLSLGTGDIATETTTIDLTVDKQTYFEVMQQVSDYWVSAATQLQYDFYVDTDNDLVWDTRPLRTTGVETLTEGQNILGYQVTRDGTGIKNEIYVYGKREVYNPSRYGSAADVQNPTTHGRTFPSDGDQWTDDGNWTADSGSVSSGSTSPKVGSDYTHALCDSGTGIWEFKHTNSAIHVEGVAGYPMLEFWVRRNVTLAGAQHDVRVLAPDESNYFYTEFTDPGSNGVWGFNIFNLGPNNEYETDENPNGDWQSTGSPDWEDMQGIEFYANVGAAEYELDVDGLCFSFGRYRNSASDATSQSNYGQRDIVVVNDDLTSDSECQSHAETLLYKQKDPVVRIDVTTELNTNILIGDRLSMTIDAENISSANYDVVSVDHFFDSQRGAITTASMINRATTREMPVVSGPEILMERRIKHNRIARGLRAVAR